MPAPAQRTATRPTYPIPRPYATDDRFSVALVQDVANVLVGHGYAGITDIDLVRLTLALSEFIYDGEG